MRNDQGSADMQRKAACAGGIENCNYGYKYLQHNAIEIEAIVTIHRDWIEDVDAHYRNERQHAAILQVEDRSNGQKEAACQQIHYGFTGLPGLSGGGGLPLPASCGVISPSSTGIGASRIGLSL